MGESEPWPDLDLRLVRYFTVVAKYRHFGHAAEVLRVSQPSLSRQIRGLEQQIGARLLDRNAQGTQLTEAGEVFLRHAKAMSRAVGRAAAETRTAASPHRVGIGYPTGSFITAAG